jgi:hypothetical protein
MMTFGLVRNKDHLPTGKRAVEGIACVARGSGGRRRPWSLVALCMAWTSFAGAGFHRGHNPLHAAAPEPEAAYYPLAQVGGTVRTVAAGGGRLYVAIGRGLESWDPGPGAGQPARRLGPRLELIAPVAAMAVEGWQVFVLMEDPERPGIRLQVLDFSDPTRPRLRGELALFGRPLDIQVAGAWLYIASESGGWQVVDVRDPARPRLAQQIVTAARNTALAGDRAAVAVGGAVLILDISDPASPEILRMILGGGQDVAIAGDFIYWTRPDHPSVFVDLLDPDPMRSADAFERIDVGMGDGPGLLLAGDWLLVSGEVAVAAVDLSQPEQPRALGRLDLPAVAVRGMAADSWRLYLAAGGLKFYNLGGRALPRPLPAPALPSDPRQALAEGGRLYLAGGASGFWILDIGRPEAPALLAHVDLPNVSALRIRDGLAYLACGRTGLFVLDLKDPTQPALLSNFKTPDEVSDLVLDGDLAYLAGGRSGIRVADISDPRAPRFVGAYEAPGFDPLALAIDAEAGLLLAAAGEAGLQVFELGEDGLPRYIGAYGTPDAATDVAFLEGRAVVGYRQAGLRAFDLKDPSRPRLLDFLLLRDFRAMQPGAGPVGDAVEGDLGSGWLESGVKGGNQNGGAHLLWLAAGREGLGRAGLSLEGRWQWMGSIPRPGLALTMVGPAGGPAGGPAESSVGNLIYAAAGDEGLLLLEPRPSQRLWLPLVTRP